MIRFCNVYLPGRLLIFIFVDAIILLGLGIATLHTGPAHFIALPSFVAVVKAVFVWTVLIWAMYLFDLYDLDLKAGLRDYFLRCLRAVGCAALLLVPVWWFLVPSGTRDKQIEISLLAFVLLFVLYRLSVEAIRSIIFPGERLLLIGSGPVIDLLSGALEQRFSRPIQLSAVIPSSVKMTGQNCHFAACGTLDDVERVCALFRPDRVAVGGRSFAEKLQGTLLKLRQRGITVEDAVALYESLSGRVPVRQVDMWSMAVGVGLKPKRLAFYFWRFFGTVIALFVGILLSPFFLLIALAIKLDSPGPILYGQERVGMNGELFHALKFRSMRHNAESISGPVWAEQNDPRVTRVGRILRRTRLDEFPQLWNVIAGEMCLVGPRPERPHFTAILAEQVPFYDVRHSVPPGITGWAQVNASYGASIEESRIKLEYDLFYLKNQGPLLDSLIILKTIKIALFGRGAR